MRILITFALDLEFSPWRRMHSFAKSPGKDFAGYDGKVDDAQVRIVLTGVGGVRAKSAVGAALEWQPDICIAAGLAGSLRAEYRIGQILAARDTMELESGRTVSADASLLSRAEACGAVVIDRLLTSPAMVLSAEGKQRLGSMAGAVEMESFAVAREASAAHIPVIAIRAISDNVDEDLPMDFAGVLDDGGNVSTGKMAHALAHAPHKVPALIRLGRNSRAASMKLAEFFEGYVSALAAASHAAPEMAEARRA